jgi:alkylation response protein AidB-like acyl-CoA dehydrogenase
MVDFSIEDGPEQQQWRAEVRAFLDAELEERIVGFDWDYDENDELWAATRDFWRKVGQRGWIGSTWPKEFGGGGKSAVDKWILHEELVRYRAPDYPGIGLQVASHVLRLGTDEQRKQHVRGVATADILWGEGYTEPDAGSDLASLTTTAVRDGDEWVINGQKTFGTAGHRAEWMAVFARTDPTVPKHAGLTCFLVKIDTPGISMTPMRNLAGGRQNATFFDNVRVPLTGQLGTVNRGWQEVWFQLGGERLDRGAPAPSVREGRLTDVLDMVIEYCKETKRDGRPLSEHADIRAQLADLLIGVESLKLFEYESFWRSTTGTHSNYGGYLAQAYYKEFWPRFAQQCMEIIGPLAIVYAGKYAPLAGAVDALYRTSFGNHAGGTSQVKRMVLATRALGLPR